MSLLQWPFKRISRPGLGNPAFVDDILAANQSVLDGLGYLFSNTPFAILYGLIYTQGAPGSYSTGIVWINGQFGYVTGSHQEGLYLNVVTQDTLPKTYSDTNQYNTYTLLQVTASNAPQPGSSPQLIGSMDQWRMDFSTLKQAALSAAEMLSELGNSALLDVGITANTVAAGNDPRLVGNTAYFDGRFAQRTAVIEKGTATAYVPAEPNDPVNKAYADQFVKILAKGYKVIGDADVAGGTSITIAMGVTLPDTNYAVIWSLESYAVNPAVDTFYQLTIRNKTDTSFDVRFREAQTGIQNVNLAWYIIPL